MKWSLKNWAELNVDELHLAYKLRTDVFVVEQGCAYPEVDEYDPRSQHLFVWKGDELCAYARVCPPGTVYKQPSLGRIVVASNFRGSGLGKQLVQKGIELLRKNYPKQQIKIQAQEYLEDFYGSFGFKTISPSYPDAMVMHVDMVLE